MACDYLIPQATSIASEQIFSVEKHAISATHNQLDPEKAQASLCLKMWYNLGLIKNCEYEVDLVY